MRPFPSIALYDDPNERLPIPDALFSLLCRASPNEARDLAAALAGPERARLALFCNARSHLRERGRAVASVCDLQSLVAEGGEAGLVLFGQVNAGPDTWGAPPSRTAAGRVGSVR